jgi:c(7)-type cytochrome triheme protein
MRTLLTCLIALSVLSLSQSASAEQGDIVFTRKSDEGSGYPPATFPHSVHRYQFKCYVCHDAIFKMKAGADEVSMQKIEAGKYCGVCHNGTTAFGTTFESCQRCHR